MAYEVPGRADNVSADVLNAWNAAINREHRRQMDNGLGSRFFSIDPAAIPNSKTVDSVKWFANPAEPEFCIDATAARQLSDWGARGRANVQNEYCEYAVIFATDSEGKRRPKRVEITTELREYWLIVATLDPDLMLRMATEVLGFTPPFADLYGADDPHAMTPQQRMSAFTRLVAGAPGQPPTGKINTEHALFMTHTINGLDDLVYVVMFGALPYAKATGGGVPKKATRDEIFRAAGATHLACRHADPGAAMGAYEQVFEGRTIALANPLGMYIRPFSTEDFQFKGAEIPQRWVRSSRGQGNLVQHIVFGPDDADDAFLDEIKLVEGEQEQELTGGYQIVKQLEVGPLVVVGQPSEIARGEFRIIQANSQQILCQQADICQLMRTLKAAYDAENPPQRTGPRRVGRL